MAFHTFARSRYGTDLLGRVAAGWRRIADDQRRGVISAARIAADLAALDAPPALLMTAGHVIQEEIHHLEVCARVIEGLDPRSATMQQATEADDLQSAAGLERGLPRASITSETRLARTLVAEYAHRQTRRADSCEALADMADADDAERFRGHFDGRVRQRARRVPVRIA